MTVHMTSIVETRDSEESSQLPIGHSLKTHQIYKNLRIKFWDILRSTCPYARINTCVTENEINTLLIKLKFYSCVLAL